MNHILSWLILVIACQISLINSSFLQLQKQTEKKLSENELPNLRIVGGQPALRATTKHQVSLRLKSNEIKYGFGYGHICGGSLIEPNLVLIAAHCLYKENSNSLRKPSDFTVVMGTMNITVKEDDTLVYSVKKLKVHKRYNSKTVQNDIALLILEKDVPTNHTKVKPIPLTKQDVQIGSSCQISGWGSTGNDKPGSFYLLAANITIQDIDRCNSSTSYNGQLKPGMLCAGYFQGNIDSCQGDSGGPMVCNGVLAGVISWGNRCALPRYPGIYSDVYYYRDWIENNSSVSLFSSLLIVTFGFIMTLLI